MRTGIDVAFVDMALRRSSQGSVRSPFGRARMATLAVAALAGALLVGCGPTIQPFAIEDAQIAARVKTALVNDPEVGELPLEVRASRGVVTLSGRVRAPAQADRAVDLARRVAGVARVDSELQVGTEPADVSAAPPDFAGVGGNDPLEIDPRPGLLALGASVGWSIPGPAALKTRATVSPLIKIGSPRGLGPAIGFDWFQSNLQSVGNQATLTRVNVKPVMAGVGYTMLADRLSLTPSLVGGYAFNSLTVTDTGTAQGLPVEVGNSFVGRIGVSAWYDASRRIAVNVSTGYLMTRFRLTVLDDNRLVRQQASGNTTLLHVGLAYRLF